MRPISSLIIFFSSTGIACAHNVESGHGWAEQLGHQLLGAHHLAVTVILIMAGIVTLRICYRMSALRNDK